MPEGTAPPVLGHRGWDLYLVAAAALVPIVVPAGPAQSAGVDLLNAVALGVFAVLSAARRLALSLPFALPVLLIAAGSLLAMTQAASVGAGLITLVQDAYLYAWCVMLVAILRVRGDGLGFRVAWLWAANAVALLCLGQSAADGARSPLDLLSPGAARSAGTFYGPNMCADYLVLSAFVALGLVGRLRSRWIVVSLGLLALGLLATQSNGGLVSLGVGLVAWAAAGGVAGAVTRARLAGAVACATAIVMVWGVAPWGAGEHVAQLLRERTALGRVEHSGLSRSAIWQRLEEDYRRAPLGIGPGNSPQRELGIGEWERSGSARAKEAHNDYIAYAVERGPLARKLVGAALMQLAHAPQRVERNDERRAERALQLLRHQPRQQEVRVREIVSAMSASVRTNPRREVRHRAKKLFLAYERRRSSGDVDHAHAGSPLDDFGQRFGIAAREDVDLAAELRQLRGDLRDVNVLAAAVDPACRGER